MSSITSSVESGEGGQRQPLGDPSHPSAPMGAGSPPGATREGKSMCCHGGILKPEWVCWCLEHPQDDAAPQGQPPPWHPPAFSGSRATPGMGVWLVGRLVGMGTSVGTLGTVGQSRGSECGTTTGCAGRQRSLGDIWDIAGVWGESGAHRRAGARGPGPAGSPPGPPSRPHAGASSGA